MRVLVLSPYPFRLKPALEREEVVDFMGPPSEWPEADFVVSYGYRHKIGAEQIAKYANRIVNLHISYLPWNRGADPNFWSWFDDTPKGVSIHFVDEGIDTGPVINCRTMAFSGHETLASSYGKLHFDLIDLFAKTWGDLRDGYPVVPLTTDVAGSRHYSNQKLPFFGKMPLGWDTPVAVVEEMGRKHREAVNETV